MIIKWIVFLFVTSTTFIALTFGVPVLVTALSLEPVEAQVEQAEYIGAERFEPYIPDHLSIEDRLCHLPQCMRLQRKKLQSTNVERRRLKE